MSGVSSKKKFHFQSLTSISTIQSSVTVAEKIRQWVLWGESILLGAKIDTNCNPLFVEDVSMEVEDEETRRANHTL